MNNNVSSTSEDEIRHKPALLAWVLGNEVPTNILAHRGDAPIRAGLEQLYRAVKQEEHQSPGDAFELAAFSTSRFELFRFFNFNVYPLAA